MEDKRKETVDVINRAVNVCFSIADLKEDLLLELFKESWGEKGSEEIKDKKRFVLSWKKNMMTGALSLAYLLSVNDDILPNLVETVNIIASIKDEKTSNIAKAILNSLQKVDLDNLLAILSQKINNN